MTIIKSAAPFFLKTKSVRCGKAFTVSGPFEYPSWGKSIMNVWYPLKLSAGSQWLKFQCPAKHKIIGFLWSKFPDFTTKMSPHISV